jgi:hypothetical protein
MALRGFKKRLVESSVDAYVLSLETINRLSVEYRLESFCILLCNAWELLLKARLVQLEGRRSIYYPKRRGERLRTLSARDCAKRVFPNQELEIRRNLEKVIDLRDECSHLVIGVVPSDIMELLQSCVINYHECLSDWFEVSLSDRVPLGMMTIVFDASPLSSDIKLLRKRLGAEEIKFLTRFQAEMREEAWILGHPREYLAQIEHKVAVVNKPGQADVQLIRGEGGAPIQVIEKAKDPAKTHPLYEADAIAAIRSRIPDSCRFNSYSFQAMCEYLEVRKREAWFYKLGLQGARSQYSHALVDEMARRIIKDPSCIDHAREAYSARKRALGHYRGGGARRNTVAT